MSLRVRLVLAVLPLALVAGYAVAQGFQPNFIRNFVGPVTVTGNLTASGDIVANTVSATAATDQFACSGPGVGICSIRSPSDRDMNVDCGGGSCSTYLGVFNATGVSIGHSGGFTFISGTLDLTDAVLPALASTGALSGTSLTVGSTDSMSLYRTGTKAVTGGSIGSGSCANQGTTITVTGASAGDACFLGLSASPGNGLTYWCVVGSNSCQIVACNPTAGNLTSLTGTHRCTVIH